MEEVISKGEEEKETWGRRSGIRDKSSRGEGG